MNVLIVGGGKIGTYLASLLLSEGHQVKVIEVQAEEIARLKRELPEEVTILGNGTDPNVLEAAGIRQANVLAAVTGDDEINLVATSLARFEFRVPRIIGRVNNPKNAWLYSAEMGVDVALNQADLIARMVAEEMSLGDMMTLLKFRKGLFSLVEEKAHPESMAVGKALRDLPLPTEATVVAVMRKGSLLIPHGSLVFQPADEVLALVHQSKLAEFARLLARAK
jgi:trk system potassium uptake protein TrkA